jgi:hypothetical protein
MTESNKNAVAEGRLKEVTLPCGCIYIDEGWMLTRVAECDNHKRKRTIKRPYRPKAECVRP